MPGNRDTTMLFFLSKRTKREPILQLSGFDEVDDPFGDAVFVGGVVFLFEVVFEEFGDKLPEVGCRFAFVLLDEFVAGAFGLAIHEFHEHHPLRGVHTAEILLVFTKELSLEGPPPPSSTFVIGQFRQFAIGVLHIFGDTLCVR